MQRLRSDLRLVVAAFDASPEMRYLAHCDRWRRAFNAPAGSLIDRSHYECFPGIGPDATDPEMRRWWECHELARSGQRTSGDSTAMVNGVSVEFTWGHEPWVDTAGTVVGFWVWAIEARHLDRLIPALAGIRLGQALAEVFDG